MITALASTAMPAYLPEVVICSDARRDATTMFDLVLLKIHDSVLRPFAAPGLGIYAWTGRDRKSVV